MKKKSPMKINKFCHICEKEFCSDSVNEKEYKSNCKVRDHCHYTGKYRGAAHSICNLRYKIPRVISLVLHNGSTYDYHFIIKQLVKEFKDEYSCFGENTEKYITFSRPFTKIEFNKGKEITYKLKFINSYIFMPASLSILVDNLSEINKKEPENEFIDSMRSMTALISSHIDNLSEINKKEPENEFIDRMRSMAALLSSHIDDLSKINKKILLIEFIKTFPSIYKFCNKDLNKFVLLLRKGVYPYEYMDSWERFNEASLPDKEYFYSNLYLEDITDEDYLHTQKIWDVFVIKNLGEYHDFYVQTDTLLLAEVFESFRDKCLEIYELNPAHFLSAPGLSWQACLKKTGIKLELLTDNDMLIIDQKRTIVGMCHAVQKCAKANNIYMKNYD